MLHALRKFNPGVTVQCVEAIHSIHRLADMRVDNKDMWTESLAAGLNNEKDSLMKDFHWEAKAWGHILFVSVGLLALYTCYWWMVDWKWNEDTPRPLR